MTQNDHFPIIPSSLQNCPFIFCFVALPANQQLWSWWGVSLPNHTFFLGKLEQTVNQYFLSILWLVTDNNPSSINQRKGGE